MKVVINKCWGGFSVSKEALLRMRELGSEAAKKETMRGERWPDSGEVNDREWGGYYLNELPRHDPILVRVVEELKQAASGEMARLVIVEIPDSTEYEVSNYDGMEHIAEAHRTWG